MKTKWMGSILLAGVLMAEAGGAERTVTLTDWTGRGFAPDLVRYTVPLPRDGGKSYRVLTADGKLVPVQFTPAEAAGQVTLNFVAEILPGSNAVYILRDNVKGPAAPVAVSSVSITNDAGFLLLANQWLTVKMPEPVEKKFSPAVPSKTLPAPVLGFRGRESGWRGEGLLLSARPVSALRIRQLAAGPVFAEVRYELEYEGGGYYHATIRVTDQQPFASVTEEYDLGRWDNTDYWQLDLSQGWAPDSAEIMSAAGQGFTPVSYPTLVSLARSIPPGTAGAASPGGQAGEIPVRCIQHDSCWGARYVSYFGVHSAAERQANPAGYTLAVVAPLHKGAWRRPNSIPVFVRGNAARVRFPMAVMPQSWLNEPTSDVSPFSCHEHDSACPATYGCREWALLLAPPPLKVTPCGDGPGYSARNLYGTVGLDRYKDYVLEWTEPETKTVYPRVFLTPEQVAQYRQALNADPSSPLAKELKDYCLFQADRATVQAELKKLDAELSAGLRYLIESLAVGHQQGDLYASIATHADSVLSWSDLPAVDRARIRTKLAALSYLMIEPDVMSHGDGSNSGSPNMGLARQMDLLNFVALLPDHPMYRAWRDYAAGFMAYKTGTFMAPGGGWIEYGIPDHLHGYAAILRGLMGLNASGATEAGGMREYNRQDLGYLLNLLTPYDPRYRSRLLPGDAHSPRGTIAEYLLAMGTVADADPGLAGSLRWAWEHNGQSLRGLAVPAMVRPWLPSREPELTSQIYPGFGVIFRAHPGPDETYLFFRSGYSWSHWGTDQGHFSLNSKGAPLIPCQPYAYDVSKQPGFDRYNLIRFGHPENLFPQGWPDSGVLDHAFGPTVDYAWSSTGFPDWYLQPGAAKPAYGGPRKLAEGLKQQPGAFTWNRQILFLKGATARGPNYFVLRDTTEGAGKLASWLNLNLLGRERNVEVTTSNVLAASERPVKLEVLFPGRAALAFDRNEDPTPMNFAPYNKLAGDLSPEAPLSRDWAGKNGLPATPRNEPAIEQHVQLRLPGAPGDEFFWVLYPRGQDEAAPQAAVLAPGVMKIVTAENTDYVFLSPTNLTFESQGVSFPGRAGAVRVRNSGVTLALTGGPGQAGYQGYVITGAIPFERTVARADLHQQTENLPPPEYQIKVVVQLTGHQPLAPGLTKATAPGATEYVLDSPAPISATDGAVSLNARRAAILISTNGVRFVVPERAYARLTAGAVGVRGLGPFDLTFTPEGIRGSVDGDRRTLVATWPEKILRPMYHQDGTRWYAGFADEQSITKGTAAPQFSLAFGVEDGRHHVEIAEWEFPALPPVPARVAVATAEPKRDRP